MKYMDLLYERGYLNPELTPADLESAQKEFTYQEAAYTAAKFSGRLKRQVGLKDKNRQKPFPADQWWELYREILKEADPDENVKEITAIYMELHLIYRERQAGLHTPQRGSMAFRDWPWMPGWIMRSGLWFGEMRLPL